MPALAITHLSAVTEPDGKPVARGAVAGMMILASLLLFGAIGGLVGALTGLLGIFLVVGIFIGFVVGIVAVRQRFPDL